MRAYLLADFGSTCTKLTAADAESARVLGTARAFTTVDTDIVDGFDTARAELEHNIGKLGWEAALACSSAAGGLKVVAVGLVPELTAEAARRAALSAGAKVSKAYSYEITEADAKQIEALRPDIILLTGGTDGGNRTVLLHNAAAVAAIAGDFPVVVAGNRSASDEAGRILGAAGKEYAIMENVMPVFNELNILPARECIRDVFLKRIVRAKGLSRAEALIGGILMPTPAAVLTALEALSRGVEGESGVGELAAVDVGGATTDVYSIGAGLPTAPGVIFKGLPEPYAKRTVEGDIGVRWTARSLMEAAGLPEVAAASGLPPEDVLRLVEAAEKNPALLPAEAPGLKALDGALCALAVRIAVERHAGRLEAAWMPFGRVWTQTGKDLGGFTKFIGIGGPVLASDDPAGLLRKSLGGFNDGAVLAPRQAEVLIDKRYVLAAMGLLCGRDPAAAVKIMKKELGM